MRKNTLAYLCLTLAVATPMPSVADNPVELRPDDPVYIKLGKKSTWQDDVRQIHDKINADYKLNNAMENSKRGS